MRLCYEYGIHDMGYGFQQYQKIVRVLLSKNIEKSE